MFYTFGTHYRRSEAINSIIRDEFAEHTVVRSNIVLVCHVH